MTAAYRYLAIAVSVLTVVQAMAIAFAVFGLGAWIDDGHTLTKSAMESSSSHVGGEAGFAVHGIGAMVVAAVALALLVVAFFARFPGALRWAGLIVGDVVLQWALAFAAFGAPVIGVLHALNAFVLFGLGMAAAAAARRSVAPQARTSVVA